MADEMIAVFGDMHGNAVALAAVVEDFKRQEIERLVCVGDAVQGGTQPRQVVEMLRELDCPVVMGNSDSWIATDEANEPVAEPTRQVGDWTRKQLGEDGLDFIRGFPLTVEIQLGGGRRLLAFHGCPSSFDAVLLPELTDEEFREVLGDPPAPYLAGGHTHIQYTREVGGSIFLNPGSAGVAYNRYFEMEDFYIYPIAQYAVLHVGTESARIEFRQVPFDVDLLEEGALASGRPYAENEGRQYRPKVKSP
ncbi:MAG TPA: metallophosphoesterase family protein [Actinomycetota bacterium]|nr:metallophosphoesterase family protein [Actinomycetota bacterium]